MNQTRISGFLKDFQRLFTSYFTAHAVFYRVHPELSEVQADFRIVLAIRKRWIEIVPMPAGADRNRVVIFTIYVIQNVLIWHYLPGILDRLGNRNGPQSPGLVSHVISAQMIDVVLIGQWCDLAIPFIIFALPLSCASQL